MTLKEQFEAEVKACPILSSLVDEIEQQADGVVSYSWDGLMNCAMVLHGGRLYDLGDGIDLDYQSIVAFGSPYKNLEALLWHMREGAEG